MKYKEKHSSEETYQKDQTVAGVFEPKLKTSNNHNSHQPDFKENPDKKKVNSVRSDLYELTSLDIQKNDWNDSTESGVLKESSEISQNWTDELEIKYPKFIYLNPSTNIPKICKIIQGKKIMSTLKDPFEVDPEEDSTFIPKVIPFKFQKCTNLSKLNFDISNNKKI